MELQLKKGYFFTPMQEFCTPTPYFCAVIPKNKQYE